jgi:hypothetical protein
VSGTLTPRFTLSGGGGSPVSTVDPTIVTAQLPEFGLDAFDVGALGADGKVSTQAGGHPDEVVTSIDFNTMHNPGPLPLNAFPVEAPRNVIVELPAGFIGNPTGLEHCTTEQLILRGLFDNEESRCSPGSQVGTLTLHVNMGDFVAKSKFGPLPLFNMVPPPGVPARFGTVVIGTPVVIDARLRRNGEYALAADSRNIPNALGLAGVTVTFWGNPGSAEHDAERACPGEATWPYIGGPTCSTHSSVVFLRNPTSCTQEPLPWRVHIDSWDHPGTYDENGDPNLRDPAWKFRSIVSHEGPGYPLLPSEWGAPVGVTGCDRVPVHGNLQASSTAIETETSSGLTVHVEVPNPGLENPEGIASSDLKAVKVTLPQGMTINPSQAEGLGVCTPAQYASTVLSFHPDPSKGCPSDSKIGTVVLHTPLLEEQLEGNVFIAAPHDNPFGTLLALYMVIESPERGVLIKQAGKVELDPVTGQITTSFSEIPQLPFASFDFKFREGARAPLVTPPLCGTYTTGAVFTPWSDPSHTVESKSQFEIVHGIGGGACPTGGTPPFAPQVVSGSLNNNAASYTPFDLHIMRQDGEQEITKFTTILPPGLTGNLTGIPFCPDAAIEAARRRTGQQELTEPSCSAASEIGHTIVGAGVGSVLAHTPGKVYLAGPYHGSALSVVSITSAAVGPFDLGTVVIRFALRINPITAQPEIDSTGSDPIPHIIDGIVVHVRDIRVYIDRSNFILNPTSCNPMSITDAITGAGADISSAADDRTVNVASRFQAADCANLQFKPKFAVSTSGKTSRVSGASLKVKLSYPKAPVGNQANIATVKVDLPKALPSRLTTLNHACPAAVFKRNPADCPSQARVGVAKAVTPVLPVPLEGPAYFVSHGGEEFPNLIIVLQGYGVTVDLVGDTFIKNGTTSSTFKQVPDVPVGSFELTLPEGPFSALAANRNLCKAKLVMPIRFVAQNGAVMRQSTRIQVTGCPRHKASHAGGRRKR